MSEKKSAKHKLTKKERERALRNDGLKKPGGVNYNLVVDKRIDDPRHEREKAYKLMLQKQGVNALKEKEPPINSTIDVLNRMAAGLEGRKIADKISDPNRPTWEQYKKENEDKLSLVGGEVKKMVEYRLQLDKERQSRLSEVKAKKTSPNGSDEEEEDRSDSDDEKGHKSHKKQKLADEIPPPPPVESDQPPPPQRWGPPPPVLPPVSVSMPSISGPSQLEEPLLKVVSVTLLESPFGLGPP